MEHKKFLELEKIVSESIKNNKSARELTLEIVEFLEIENKNPFEIISKNPGILDKFPIYTPRENVVINDSRARASI